MSWFFYRLGPTAHSLLWKTLLAKEAQLNVSLTPRHLTADGGWELHSSTLKVTVGFTVCALSA